MSSNMKWSAHIDEMLSRGNKKLWILRRLSLLGASQADLIDVYIKRIRSILEYAVPAWQSSISQTDRYNIERIQKSACHIILGNKYNGYVDALEKLELQPLESRITDRVTTSLTFYQPALMPPLL